MKEIVYMFQFNVYDNISQPANLFIFLTENDIFY